MTSRGCPLGMKKVVIIVNIDRKENLGSVMVGNMIRKGAKKQESERKRDLDSTMSWSLQRSGPEKWSPMSNAAEVGLLVKMAGRHEFFFVVVVVVVLGLHLEPPNLVMGFFKIGFLELFAPLVSSSF
jgi:hypothetical protein